MFVSDRLVYLQLQKTGCTHITRLLRANLGGCELGKHSRLEAKGGGRFVLGSIRDPWAWYVSLWAYGCAGQGGFRRRSLIRSPRRGYHLRRLPRALGLGSLPRGDTARSMAKNLFKPTGRWRRLYADSDDPRLFRAWLGTVLDSRRRFDFGEGYGYTPLARFAGLLTYRYVRLYWRDLSPLFHGPRGLDLGGLRRLDAGLNLLDFTIRNEALEADLVAALRAAGTPLSAQREAAVLAGRGEKTNASRHAPLEHYYDAAARELIGERERFIIERYGYTPPALA